MQKCLICKSTLLNKIYDDIVNNVLSIDCPRCGKFQLEKKIKAMIDPDDPHEDWRWVLSYWIRNNQSENKPVKVTVNIFSKIPYEINLPTLHEQSENLILFLGSTLTHYAENIERIGRHVTSIIGAKFPSDVDYISSELSNRGLIYFKKCGDAREDGPICKFGLTFNGWEKYHEILIKGSDSKISFMAMQYDEKMIKIFREYFVPAVEETGFELRILKDVLQAGLIDNQLRVEIRKSRILLADLSHNNNGAYWEAGYAEGLGKPVIYLCEKKAFDDIKTKPHFDTNHHTTIIWDLDNIYLALNELKATIRATLPFETIIGE